jgi:hypothetical protein
MNDLRGTNGPVKSSLMNDLRGTNGTAEYGIKLYDTGGEKLGYSPTSQLKTIGRTS